MTAIREEWKALAADILKRNYAELFSSSWAQKLERPLPRKIDRPDIAQEHGLARAWMQLQDDGTYMLVVVPIVAPSFVTLEVGFSNPALKSE